MYLGFKVFWLCKIQDYDISAIISLPVDRDRIRVFAGIFMLRIRVVIVIVGTVQNGRRRRTIYGNRRIHRIWTGRRCCC